MIQKCSYTKILEVFFKEPLTIHFIREIGKKIKLAPTSVKKNIEELLKENLIIKQKSKPFAGYIANRESELFLHYKKTYNFYSLYDLKNKLIQELYPQAIVVFGSYCLGEDIEESDIDIVIVSKITKDIDLQKFEKILERKINIITVKNLDKLDENIKKKVYNGFVIHGNL